MVWRDKPKFVIEDVDRYGNVRLYYSRRGQRKIRIREMPGSPEFGRPMPPPRKGAHCRMQALEGPWRAPPMARSGGLRRHISRARNMVASTRARKWSAAA